MVRFQWAVAALFFVLIPSFSVNGSWEHTGGPGAGHILSLAVSGQTLFAGLNSGGIFRSVDNGSTWKECDSGLADKKETITALLIYNSKIFAATANGLFRSIDNGDSWNRVTSMTESSITSFAVIGDAIFIGSMTGGVFASSDSGKTWSRKNSGLEDSCILSLTVSGTKLLAGTHNFVYCSTNKGSSWNTILSRSSMRLRSVAVFGDTIIVGASPYDAEGSIGVIRSVDGGETWGPSDTTLKYKKVETLAKVGDRLVAGTAGEGLFVSEDNGESWRRSSLGLTCNMVTAFASSDQTMFAATEGGVFRSTDAQTWEMASAGIAKVCVKALTFSSDTVYAGTEKDGVFVSVDNGATWTQRVDGLKRDHILSLASNGSALFAGTDSMGLFRAQKLSWSASGASTISNLSIDNVAAFGSTVFARSPYDIFRSTDNGDRWTSIRSALPSGAGHAFAVRGDLIFAGADSGVCRSSDGGATWSRCDAGIYGKKVISLAVAGDAIFAGTYLDGIYRSKNDGTNWTRVTPDWSFGIEQLVAVGKNVFGLGSTSVFVSADTGRSWQKIQDEIAPEQFVSLTSNGSMIFVGTRFNGIWRRKVSEVVSVRKPQAAALRRGYALDVAVRGTDGSRDVDIVFSIARPGHVTLDIFSVSGRLMASVVNGALPAGEHRSGCALSGVAAGRYLARLRAGSMELTANVLLVK